MPLAIARRPIGHEHPPYVIAELGVNHDGSPERALHLVRLAANAGADAIKVQIFRADLLMSRASRLARYQAGAGETDPADMLRRLELPLDAQRDVLAEAHRLGLAAIATVFSLDLVGPASGLVDAQGRGFDAWKTASPDIIHLPLLEALAATRRPLIISTGASTPDEIAQAVAWLDAGHARPSTPTPPAPARPDLALLQCVSAYPTPPELASLEGIDALRLMFPDLPIGYSDHTTGTDTGARAVDHGAVILEKHFTDDPRAAGPDHAASLDPAAFRLYADGARRRWSARGRPTPAGPPPRPGATKSLLDIERDVRAVSRQSIVATRAMPAGHVLGPGDVTFKRPGTGVEPFRLEMVLNRPLSAPIEADTPLTPRHLAPTAGTPRQPAVGTV